MTNEKNSSADKRVGSTDVLAATGFQVCEFEPDFGERCEKCGTDNRQQHFRTTDPFSLDGEYWCLFCIGIEHAANQLDLAANAKVSRDD